MVKRFRKRHKINIIHKVLVPVKPNKIIDKKYIIKTGTYPISETDRITYVLKLDQDYCKAVITCISLDILFNDKWVSIERFDTEHGFLHWHVLTKINEKPKVKIPLNLKKNATLDYIFNWVINHLYNNFYFYRRHFIKNNRDRLKNSIDNY